jgi:hypothetical protein
MSKSKNATREKVLELIAPLVGQANNITIPRAFIYATGSLEAALLLSQIVYWTDRATMSNGWFAKSYREWHEEIYLSEYQVRKATELLSAVGVETIIRKFAGAPTVHYRLNSEVFGEWILKKLQERNTKNFGMETEENSVSSTSPTASPTAAPTAKRREKRAVKQSVPKEQIDPMKEAILSAFKWSWDGMTEDEMGMVYKAARQLCVANYTPEDVKGIHAYCVAQKFDGFGPMALTKHATAWRSTRPKKPTMQVIPLYDTAPPAPAMPDDVQAAMAAIVAAHRNKVSDFYHEDEDNGNQTSAA